jgi:predicted porin
MKKSLIALAALSAFATAAQAQSSVSVYGVIDTGYLDSETKLTAPAGGQVKLETTGIANSPLQTSRWGLRGSEDLGGGLKAGFQLEAGLVTDSVAGTAGTSNLGTRPSFLSLSSSSWGEARVGRQDTPIHASFGRFNTGGQNNMPGSIYSTFGTTLVVGATGTLADGVNGDGTTGIFTTDEGLSFGRYDTTIDKAVTYTTPVINGFQAQIIYSNETTKLDATNTGIVGSGKAQAKQQGFNISYKVGKLDVGYGRHEKEATVAAGLNTTTGAAATASKAESTQEVFGASYDFGVVKAFAQHFKMKNENATTTIFKNEATEVGVRVPVSAKTTLMASVLEGKNKFDATSSFDRSGYQLGALYALSKRTNLYAIYGDQELKGQTELQGVNLEQTAYTVGLRHTF